MTKTWFVGFVTHEGAVSGVSQWWGYVFDGLVNDENMVLGVS